uniref:Neurotransmitter-gated ion-channel ligand-binding domain-containing protein n=1 Tax=Strigamia maritima TaxID=126957 RepID=T1J4J6_STRMM
MADEHEYRLTRYLMANYDAAVRPSHNATESLQVVFGISLHHIIDVDEKNQILTTNCWLTQVWTDAHLKWNSTDFGGIKVVRIPSTHVWKPDIILYNNADPHYNTAIVNTNVIVTSTGQVTWLSHGIFKSSCSINVEYFPFDVQVCRLKFASWTYDGLQMDLVLKDDHGDITNYQVNGEFDLDEFSAQRNVHYYSCCSEPYPDITYKLRLRRRPMFYVFNLILPCVLINGIALLVFYVPPESGEKVTLGISTLLSMTVFLMLIRENLPPTEKTPLIGMYYGVTICIVSFATGLSVITLNVHHRGVRDTEVPAPLRKLVLGILAKVLFLKFEAPSGERLSKDQFQDKSHSSDMDHIEQYNFSPRFPHRKPANPESSADHFERQFLRVLNKIYQTIERNEVRQAGQDRRDHVRIEWQQVSLVCDRFLLATFVVITAVATFAILFSSPHGP